MLVNSLTTDDIFWLDSKSCLNGPNLPGKLEKRVAKSSWGDLPR